MSGQHYLTKLKVCQKSRNISIGNNTINQVQYNQMLKGYNKFAWNWATVCQSYYVIVTSTKYSWKQQKSIFSKSGGGATRLNKNEIKARKNPFELFNKGRRRNKTGHSITLSKFRPESELSEQETFKWNKNQTTQTLTWLKPREKTFESSWCNKFPWDFC